MSNRFYDLSFEQLPSGTIRLKQEAFDEACAIDLHPWQLRAIAEHFGLVNSVPPADKLTKSLAEQLCRTYLAMCDDFRNLTHVLEEEYARLDVLIDLMPDEIFPGHLWEAREEYERALAERKSLSMTDREVCKAELVADGGDGQLQAESELDDEEQTAGSNGQLGLPM